VETGHSDGIAWQARFASLKVLVFGSMFTGISQDPDK